MSNKPTKVVGLSEVAEMLRVSRQRASQLIGAAEDFPPHESLRMGPVWQRKAVERWIKKNR